MRDSLDPPTFTKQFSEESPESPTFTTPFCKDSPESPTFAKPFCKDSPDTPTFAKCHFWGKRCQNADKITFFQGLANLAYLLSNHIHQNGLYQKNSILARLADRCQTVLWGLARLADICQMPFLKKSWLARLNSPEYWVRLASVERVAIA